MLTPDIIGLIIFALCIVLFVWNKLPIAVTALLGLAAMVIFGVVNFTDGFRNFGCTTVLLIASMMVVGRATFQTGLAQLIGMKVLNLARGNERVVVILATTVTAVISAFIANTAIMAIMIALLAGVCIKNKNIHFMNLILPVAIGSVLGGALTLVGSTPQLVAQGLIEEFLGVGNGFNFFSFIIPVGIILAVLIVYVACVGYPLGKRIWGNRPEYNQCPIGDEENTVPEKTDPKKLRIMGVIFVLTIVMFVSNDFIVQVIPYFNIGLASLISALACILTGCITFKESVKSIDWNIVLWFGACLGLAVGLNQSGGGELLATGFLSLFGTELSPIILYIIFIVLTVVMTVFISNTTVLTIVLPVVFSITASLGYNTLSFATGLCIASSISIATPIATVPMGMALVAKYRFLDFVKYGGPLTIVAVIVLIIVVPLICPLL